MHRRWWGCKLPRFRISITHAVTSEPGEIIVEADSAAEARNIAAARGYRSTSVSAVADTEPVDAAGVIRKAERVQTIQIQEGVTVLKIAWGVFLGLMMFFVCVAFVSCLAGGSVYIG